MGTSINASFVIASEARQSSALIKWAFPDRRVARLLAMTIDRSALIFFGIPQVIGSAGELLL
jgi:hypothetical protein